MEVLKSKVYLIFYQPYGIGAYKLWLPIDGRGVLLGGRRLLGRDGHGRPRVPDVTRCYEWRTVEQAIQYSHGRPRRRARSRWRARASSSAPPKVETEGVDQILTMTTDLHAGSAALGVAKLVRFPELRANKIGMDLSLLVPKAELKARALGEETFYNVDVIGEVVKDDRLIDNFKYRFDIPTGEIGGEKIPLTVRRYLYPGDYKLVLKISDGNQNAEGRDHRGARSSPSSPTRRRPRSRRPAPTGKAAVEPDQGRRAAALGDLAPSGRQGDRDRPPALRDARPPRT